MSDVSNGGGRDRLVRRRSVLAGATGGAAALLLAGCGSGSDTTGNAPAGNQGSTGSSTPTVKVNEKVTITFWNWVPGMDKAVEIFNKGNSNITLVSQSIKPETATQKMLASVKAGNPPELAHVTYSALPAYLVAGALTDITQYAQASKDKFVPWQWAQCELGGKVYGVPWASGPMGYYYRKDLFKKYGISVPKTWDDFASAAQKVHQQNPKVYLTGFELDSNAFPGMVWQAGGRWWKIDGQKWDVSIDDDPSLKVAGYWQQLLDNKVASSIKFKGDAYWKGIQDGTIMSMVGANWDDALLKGNAGNTSGKWRVALMPQWAAGQHVSANSGGSSIAVLKGAKHPKEATEAAIWLNTHADSVSAMMLGGAGWPAMADVSQVAAVSKPSEFFGGQAYQEVFAKSDANISETWRWGPTASATLTHLTDGVGDVVAGKTTLPDLLKKVQTQTLSDMKAKGLPVATA